MYEMWQAQITKVNSVSIDDYQYIYCDNCKSINRLVFDKKDGLDVTGKYLGKDLNCGQCRLVISTVYKEEFFK